MKRVRLNQAGDTIVEVLFAVIVVGVAIGLAYGVASRSLKSNRQAQERIEAVKFVESEAEQLKKIASQTPDGTGVFGQSQPFCLVLTNIVGADDPACTANNRYKLSITPTVSTTSTKQFDVTATWDSLKGGQENITVTYRVYPLSP